MKRTVSSTLAALLPIALLAFAGPAAADSIVQESTLTVSDGVNSLTLSDHGTGLIDYSSLYDPTWNMMGGWLLDVDLAMTQPYLQSSTPLMHLSIVAVGQGTLNVSFSDPNFAGPGAMDLLTQFGGVAGPYATVTGGASSPTLGSLAAFGPLGGAFSQSTGTAITANAPFGVDLFATIFQPILGVTSLDASVAVPEPDTWMLFAAAGLLGAIFLRRRVALNAA